MHFKLLFVFFGARKSGKSKINYIKLIYDCSHGFISIKHIGKLCIILITFGKKANQIFWRQLYMTQLMFLGKNMQIYTLLVKIYMAHKVW